MNYFKWLFHSHDYKTVHKWEAKRTQFGRTITGVAKLERCQHEDCNEERAKFIGADFTEPVEVEYFKMKHNKGIDTQ